MSTFIHGGSALTLDIAGKAHAALYRGDVVMINPAVGSAEDGYTTMDPITGTALAQVAPFGVVLGSAGKSSFAIGEDILIRILGIVDVAMDPAAPSVIGHGVKLKNAATHLSPLGNATWTADAINVRVCGVAHTVSAAGNDHMATVFFNGLSTWG